MRHWRTLWNMITCPIAPNFLYSLSTAPLPTFYQALSIAPPLTPATSSTHTRLDICSYFCPWKLIWPTALPPLPHWILCLCVSSTYIASAPLCTPSLSRLSSALIVRYKITINVPSIPFIDQLETRCSGHDIYIVSNERWSCAGPCVCELVLVNRYVCSELAIMNAGVVSRE